VNTELKLMGLEFANSILLKERLPITALFDKKPILY